MRLSFLFVSPLAESDTALATARPAARDKRPGSRELNDISAVNYTPARIGPSSRRAARTTTFTGSGTILVKALQ